MYSPVNGEERRGETSKSFFPVLKVCSCVSERKTLDAEVHVQKKKKKKEKKRKKPECGFIVYNIRLQ